MRNETFVDINDCSNESLYPDSEYCTRIMENLGITDKDSVIITDYDISDFRETVKKDETFDSGNLSSFRDYINTVPNIESFYDTNAAENIIGKYRLFVTRTVTESDQSTTIRYSNIGIYTGEYQKYTMGEKIEFNPGTGLQTFYVLKNSPSTHSYVTLIAANNITDDSTGVPITIETTFNNQKDESSDEDNLSPDPILQILKNNTSRWYNVEPFTASEFYKSADGYTISYEGYRARLLNENDIIEALGCKEDDKECFDYTEAFTVNFNQTDLSWLISNLGDNEGYWTSATVPGSNTYAWSIQKGKVAPTYFTDKLGVRPVITISKDLLSK